MKIDKSKLKLGVCYMDTDGIIVDIPSEVFVEKQNYPNIASKTVCFPLTVTTERRYYYDNKDTCKHPLKFRKRTNGWIKGIKGCVCTACGKTKTGKSHIPFAFMKWDYGSETYDGFATNVHVGKHSQKCIVAMVNSGDYELDEAIVVMATACERCMNVLAYKYLNCEDGYPEYSDEWKRCNTSCEFCENE